MRQVSEGIAGALPKAASVIAERGLENTRMEDIVAATGIPRPTLYYHFSSKEEILAWLLERLLRDLTVDVGHIVDRDEPARDRFAKVVRAYLEVFAQHRDLCAVLLSDLGRVTRIPTLAESIWSAFHEPVRKLLDAGSRDGSLRSVDAEVAGSAIFGALTMVGLHYIITGQPIDVDVIAARLDNLILGGLEMEHRPTDAAQQTEPERRLP